MKWAWWLAWVVASGCGRTGLAVPDAGGELDAGLALDAGGRPEALDPGEVYLLGTLWEGDCNLHALAHWSTPDAASVGFDCYLVGWGATIRPDGRLVYVKIPEYLLREYHSDPWADGGAYPANVYANDNLVPMPCPGVSTHLSQFLVSADGPVLYLCADESGWRDQAGAIVYQHPTDELISAGAGGWVLTTTRVVNLRTGTEFPITGLPPDYWRAVRWAAPDGFFIVTVGVEEVLWRISLAGLAQRVGRYPEYPPGATPGPPARLDRSGRLFELGQATTASLVDVIVRREVGGGAEVVYTEASNPRVKAHASYLVTGP